MRQAQVGLDRVSKADLDTQSRPGQLEWTWTGRKGGLDGVQSGPGAVQGAQRGLKWTPGAQSVTLDSTQVVQPQSAEKLVFLQFSAVFSNSGAHDHAQVSELSIGLFDMVLDLLLYLSIYLLTLLSVADLIHYRKVDPGREVLLCIGSSIVCSINKSALFICRQYWTGLEVAWTGPS